MGNVHRFDRAPDRLTKEDEPVPAARALLVSVGLSFLFVAVYGTTNWLASRRGDVPVFFFPWERAIPFVPFFILPYLSIDLFFVAAPFLCRSNRELKTFALRVSTAIAIAGTCFALVPLRCAFPVIIPQGWLGWVFASFLALDQPYNLLPSLHAALCLLLFELYFRRTHGLLRVLVAGWFFLMALSPVLTHQHQIPDIIAGLALAGYCFYFFRRERMAAAQFVRPNGRLASFYFVPAAVLFAIALADPRHWFVLWWIGGSLTLVSAGYLGLGPGVFRKTGDGRLPLSSWFALGPCIIGQYLSLLYYRRAEAASARITSSISMGRRLNQNEALDLCQSGITAVLDLSAELAEVRAFRRLCYLCVPVLDLTAPSGEQLDRMARFIASEAENGRVYVHCKIGFSRSAAAVAAYLVHSKQAESAGDAFAMIREKRPSVVISTATFKALEEFGLRSKSSAGSDAFLLASAPVCGP